ncbi:MAG: ABC transporter substrate-binding protein [Nevskia sp.]|nr:ABC transporter substrate-binding protein [Nevskia sp.]
MKPPKRSLARSLLLALTLVLPSAFADGVPPPAPDTALKASIEQVQGLIHLHYAEYKAAPPEFGQVVDEVVAPRFDVEAIARLVLGMNYRSASPEQRQRFATAFKDMLMRTYAGAMLDNYNSSKVTWMPPRLSADGINAEINTTLNRNDGQSLAVGFRLHLVDGDWKVLDISVENISLIFNYRTQVNAEIKRTGLDDVIARMNSGEFSSSRAG